MTINYVEDDTTGLNKLRDSKNFNQNLIKAQNFLHLDNFNPNFEMNTLLNNFHKTVGTEGTLLDVKCSELLYTGEGHD